MRNPPPLRAQFSLISCNFREILIKSYHEPPPPRGSAPPDENTGSATGEHPRWLAYQ